MDTHELDEIMSSPGPLPSAIGVRVGRGVACYALLSMAILAAFPRTCLGWQESKGWIFQWENDSFYFLGNKTDRFYTNGLRVAWWTSHTQVQKRHHSNACFSHAFGSAHSDGWAIGQNFFTPDIITTFNPEARDRPFAGLLYAGRTLQSTSQCAWGKKADQAMKFYRQDVVELQTGLTGEGSFSRTAQAGLHTLKLARVPKGWDAQLPMELAFNATYLGRLALDIGARSRLHVAVIPHWTAALGSIQTYGGAGGTVAVNWNYAALPAVPIAPTLQIKSVEPSAQAAAASSSAFGLSVSGTVEHRWVLRNYYLDGPLLGGAPRVDRETWVRDKRITATVRFDPWRFHLIQIWRTPEMTDRLFGKEQRYGSLSLEWSGGARETRKYRPRVLSAVAIEGALGRGTLRIREPADPSPLRPGPAMRAALILFPRHPSWSPSLDISGVTLPGARPASGEMHHDVLTRVAAVSLRVHSFDRYDGPGQLELQAGAGIGWAAYQRLNSPTPGSHPNESTDHGLAFLAGTRYAYAVSNEISVGIRMDIAGLPMNVRNGRSATFLATFLSVRWQPAGCLRDCRN